jgi:hypothetical protein
LSVWRAQGGNQLIKGSQKLPHLKRPADQVHGILKGWRSHQAAQGGAIRQLEENIGMARKAERAGAGQITAAQGVKLGAAPDRIQESPRLACRKPLCSGGDPLPVTLNRFIPSVHVGPKGVAPSA